MRLDICNGSGVCCDRIRKGEYEIQCSEGDKSNGDDGGSESFEGAPGLNVKDVERSIGFYTNMLGIEPSKVRTGYAKFDVQNPPLNLTLNRHNFSEQGALSHLGLPGLIHGGCTGRARTLG